MIARINFTKFILGRRGAELNRRIEILQISALPLGYHADGKIVVE